MVSIGRGVTTGFALFGVLLAVLLLGSCSTRDASVLGGDPITVNSGPAECVLSSTTSLAGKVVFDITNTGTSPSTFRIYANNGETVMGELQNIAPGKVGRLTLTLVPGGFVSACEPHGKESGLRGPFDVTGENLA